MNGGLTIVPNKNLVTNIGFDDLATHTHQGNPTLCEKFDSQLKHPLRIKVNQKTDKWTFRIQIAEKYYNKHSLKNRIKRRIKNYICLTTDFLKT
jgi:ribonuclease P protein component